MSNKEKVKNLSSKLKKNLTSQGYVVKHTHLLDAVSKSIYNQSWHSLNKDKTSQKKNLKANLLSRNTENSIYLGSIGDHHRYVQLYKSNNPTNQNILIGGRMHSGKTNAIKVIVEKFHRDNLTHSVIFVDMMKGGSEFNSFKNKSEIVTDIQVFKNLIDSLYNDLKKSPNKLINKMVVIDGAHFLSMEFDLKNRWLDEEPTGYKLKKLIENGHKIGLSFIVSSQRLTASDIPSAMLSYFPNKLIFKTLKPDSVFVLRNELSSNIKSYDIGTAHNGADYVSFPDITDI